MSLDYYLTKQLYLTLISKEQFTPKNEILIKIPPKLNSC